MSQVNTTDEELLAPSYIVHNDLSNDLEPNPDLAHTN